MGQMQWPHVLEGVRVAGNLRGEEILSPRSHLVSKRELQRLRNKGKSDVICTSEVWGQKIQGHKNCPRDASQSPEPVRSRLVAGCDSGKTPEHLVLPSYFPRQLWEGYQIMTWKRVVNQKMALISDPNCTGGKSTLIDPGLTLQTYPSVHTTLAHDELLILQIQTLENNL